METWLEQSRMDSRYLIVSRREPKMAFLDDARHSGRDSFAPRAGSWPREFMTLAVVAGCLAFWAVAVLALSYFA
jgi:hypothetical protein